LEKEILELLIRIKSNVDNIDPFEEGKADKNCENKWQASNLLLLAIDKLESK
jgi:hypothetical protein